MSKGWGLGALALTGALAAALLLTTRTERLAGKVLAEAKGGTLAVDLDRTPDWAVFGAWMQAPGTLPGQVHTSKSGEVAVLVLWAPEAVSTIPHGGRLVVTHREIRAPWTGRALGGTRLESGGRTYACGRAMAAWVGWLALLASAPLLLSALVAVPTALLAPRRPAAA